jgi:hypothetical protein
MCGSMEIYKLYYQFFCRLLGVDIKHWLESEILVKRIHSSTVFRPVYIKRVGAQQIMVALYTTRNALIMANPEVTFQVEAVKLIPIYYKDDLKGMDGLSIKDATAAWFDVLSNNKRAGYNGFKKKK